MADRVLDEDDVEGALVPLPGDDGAHAALVVPSRDHDQLAHIKLDEVLDLPGLNVEHDCVVDLRSACTALTA